MSETFEKSQMSESFDVPAGCHRAKIILYKNKRESDIANEWSLRTFNVAFMQKK